MERAWSSLRRRAVVAATRKTVLTVKWWREEDPAGSNGGFVSLSKTSVRSQAGASCLTGGLSTHMPLRRCEMGALLDNVDPSLNPLWMTPIADL